jgi:hypothetical protein
MEEAVSEVEKGIITVDEARARFGLAPIEKTETTELVKAATVDKSVDADVIKSAVTDAVTPLLEQLNAYGKQVEEFGIYKAETEARFEKLANIPDPSTSAFVGLMNPVRKGSPAGVPAQAEVAERTRQIMIRQLQRTARISEVPAEREAAYDALLKFESE